ncbi:hypothetical protein KI387_017161, partial [Taxus chinensis]
TSAVDDCVIGCLTIESDEATHIYGALGHHARGGLGGVQRYRAIDRDHSLMVALIERWDTAANVFHLPTGEMTVTLEDVYRILRLPIEGEAVFQVDFRDGHGQHPT